MKIKKETKGTIVWFTGCAFLGGSCAAIWGLAGIGLAIGIVLIVGSISYELEVKQDEHEKPGMD